MCIRDSLRITQYIVRFCSLFEVLFSLLVTRILVRVVPVSYTHLDLEEYERVKNVYILKNEMLKNSRENLRILHPLPRVNEIAYDVDDNPKAYYIQQARNGLFARQAIICEVLGISVED